MFKTSSSLSPPVFANEIFSITIQLCYIGWEITSHHHRRTRGFPVSAIFPLLSSFFANFFLVCVATNSISPRFMLHPKLRIGLSALNEKVTNSNWMWNFICSRHNSLYFPYIRFAIFPCSLTRLAWLWLFNPHHRLRSREINYKFIAESNSTSRELIPVIHSSTRDLSKQQSFFWYKKKLLNGEKSLLNEPWRRARVNEQNSMSVIGRCWRKQQWICDGCREKLLRGSLRK